MENKICLGCATKHKIDFPNMLKLRSLLGTVKTCLEFIITFSGTDPFEDRLNVLKCARVLEDIQELSKNLGTPLNIRYDKIMPDIEKALEDVTKTKKILQPHIDDIVSAMNAVEYE